MTRTRTMLAIILAAVSLPAVAQTVTDAAGQEFIAAALDWLGHQFITHKNDWAGWLWLTFPFVSSIVTWLMPRKWLFAILQGAWAPVAAILKLIFAAKGATK